MVFVHGVSGPAPGWDRKLPDVVSSTVTVEYGDIVRAVRPALGRSDPGLPVPAQPARGRPARGRPDPGRPDPGRPDPGRPDPGWQALSAEQRTVRSTAESASTKWRTTFSTRRNELKEIVSEAAARPGGTDGAGRLKLPVVIPGFLLVRSPLFGMPEAARYRRDLAARSEIHERIAELVCDCQHRVVLIGHSLGSIVAVDLLHGYDVNVELLLTIGSPIGVDRNWCANWENPDDFPADRVGGWVNVINTRDPIPWGRPIEPRFPQAVDAFISAGAAPLGVGGVHDPATYLAAPVAQEAISWAGTH